MMFPSTGFLHITFDPDTGIAKLQHQNGVCCTDKVVCVAPGKLKFTEHFIIPGAAVKKCLWIGADGFLGEYDFDYLQIYAGVRCGQHIRFARGPYIMKGGKCVVGDEKIGLNDLVIRAGTTIFIDDEIPDVKAIYNAWKAELN